MVYVYSESSEIRLVIYYVISYILSFLFKNILDGFWKLKIIVKSQEVIYVLHMWCSTHLSRRRASPVSFSKQTVLSMHETESERASPNQNPSLDFSKFSLHDFWYYQAWQHAAHEKCLLKLSAVPYINHFLLFAFIKSSPHDPVLHLKSMM